MAKLVDYILYLVALAVVTVTLAIAGGRAEIDDQVANEEVNTAREVRETA